MTDLATDIALALLIVAGGFFALLAGVGLLRLPDVLLRMHAATKVGTLASGLIVAAAALHFGTAAVGIRAGAIVLFLLLTAPIAAHMIGRAAVNTGVALWRTRRLDGDAGAACAGQAPGPEAGRG